MPKFCKKYWQVIRLWWSSKVDLVSKEGDKNRAREKTPLIWEWVEKLICWNSISVLPKAHRLTALLFHSLYTFFLMLGLLDLNQSHKTNETRTSRSSCEGCWRTAQNQVIWSQALVYGEVNLLGEYFPAILPAASPTKLTCWVSFVHKISLGKQPIYSSGHCDVVIYPFMVC